MEEEAAEGDRLHCQTASLALLACRPSSGGQTPLGSGAATMYVYKTFSPRTDHQPMDLQTPWGWVSPLFGEKEQGSGIKFFFVFKKQENRTAFALN